MFCIYISCLFYYCVFFIFFFKQKTAYEMRISDWSSDVCSSDLSNQDMVNAAMNALGTALGAAVMALLRTDKADDAKTQNTAKAFDAITAASKGPSGTPDDPVNVKEPE